ncbi:MAG: 30S ribosome-binding factor RbfA [Planctomycetota bacterium]|nr:30S ribosome-binding factor RbfA [Planctomycetota bacterium]
MNRRTERVGNLLRKTIGQLILRQLSDPRIDPARTSVTRIEIPEDLLTAKVYVSVGGDEAMQRRTIHALRHAAGHIQELMMREISLRHTPALDFVLDETFKKTLETYRIIEQAMEEIRSKDPAEQAPCQAANDGESP